MSTSLFFFTERRVQNNRGGRESVLGKNGENALNRPSRCRHPRLHLVACTLWLAPCANRVGMGIGCVKFHCGVLSENCSKRFFGICFGKKLKPTFGRKKAPFRKEGLELLLLSAFGIIVAFVHVFAFAAPAVAAGLSALLSSGFSFLFVHGSEPLLAAFFRSRHTFEVVFGLKND